MSCFGGKTKEYPSISLDRFDGNNMDSVVYFLSHCHSDHMVGLDYPEFASRLSDNAYTLYCHPVTAGLLRGMSRYEHLYPFIEPLPSDEPHSIPIPGNPTGYVSVTLIPAGHCPGSVMFLIDGESGTVLYTGDFRLHVGQTKKLQSLFTVTGAKYTFDSVYVDTTFFTEKAVTIPSRETCLDMIIKTTSNWIQREGAKRIVHIFSRSNYGYEFLMITLSKYFKTKVHVTTSQFQRYRYVPSIRECLTTDTNTDIHFCQHGDRNADRHDMPCSMHFDAVPDVLQIIPSVMYFTRGNKVTPTQMTVCENETTIRMCYSSHSSYEEIVDFLTALNPKHIYPNVKPNDKYSLEEVKQKLVFLERVSKSESDTLWKRKFIFRKRKTQSICEIPNKELQ